MKSYYFDVPTPAEAEGGDRRGWRADFYAVVIRKAEQTGWVFKFQSYGDLAEETLQALNAPRVVA